MLKNGVEAFANRMSQRQVIVDRILSIDSELDELRQTIGDAWIADRFANNIADRNADSNAITQSNLTATARDRAPGNHTVNRAAGHLTTGDRAAEHLMAGDRAAGIRNTRHRLGILFGSSSGRKEGEIATGRFRLERQKTAR